MIFERRLQAVDPYALALSTQPSYIFRPQFRSQLRGSGFLDDSSSDGSGWLDVLTIGLDAWKQYTAASNIGDMAGNVETQLKRLSDQYSQLRSQNQLSSTTITQYQQAARNLASGFCNYANQQGAAGQAACRQVSMEANNLVQSWELDRSTMGLPGFGGLSGSLPWIIGGLAVLWFLRR